MRLELGAWLERGQMVMKLDRAIKILCDATRAELVRIAFDANLFERKLCNSAHAEACYKRRNLIREAIDVAKGYIENDFQGKKDTSSSEKDTSS